MTDRPPNQFALLGQRRFLPLFLVQFLGAFNDQTFQKAFVALLTYRLAERAGLPLELLGIIASGLFILPFAIITPTAGQIADRIDKTRMMRVVKALEIGVMGLAVLGFYSENIVLLYAVLFLMGAQSAMFAPIKYSVLPQWLSPAELLGGNGLVQAGTFLAIIFGAILGNELILTEGGVALISVAVMVIALAGFAAALCAPPAPPIGAAPRIDYLLPRAIAGLIARCRAEPRAFRLLLFISWFWFLGATFFSLLPALARDGLGADETVLTVLLTGFSVGVAGGALASNRLSRIAHGLTPSVFGALGIGVMAVELWLAAQGVEQGAALADRAAFFAHVAGWRVLIDFILIAGFAGIYVTPLNAALQLAAPPEARARFIAGSNVMDAGAMVLSALLTAALVALGMKAAEMLALFSLTAFPAAWALNRFIRR